MKNRQAEYDMSTGHYMVYNMSTGKVIHVFDFNELKDYINNSYATALGGKTVIDKFDVPSMNATGFTFDKKEIGKLAVGITNLAPEEIQKMDQLTNKIKKVASNTPKARKFRPWVKVAAGVVLVGSMAGAYKLMDQPNLHQEYTFPIAEDTNEFITGQMKQNEMNPNDLVAREDMIEKLYDSSEQSYRENLDDVVIKAESTIEDKNMNTEQKREELEELKEYYTNLVEQNQSGKTR